MSFTHSTLDEGQNSFCLAQISDFKTLIATSQSHCTPVFALTDDMIGHAGTVLEQDILKRNEFNKTFSRLADEIIELTKEPI